MPTQAKVSVPALRAFEHEGRSYVRGDLVNVSPLAALALARDKKVTLSKSAVVTRDVVAEAPPAEEPIATPKRRRTYRRRDMQAETNGEA